MALSDKEKQILEFGKKQGKTKEQALAALGRYRQSQKVEEQQGGLAETAEDIKQIGTGIAEDFEQTTRDIGEGIAEGQNPFSTGLQFAGGVGKTVGSIAGRMITGIGKAVLPQKMEESIEKQVQQVIRPVVESEIGQDLIGRYDQFQKENPEAARNLRAGLGIIEGVTTFGTGGAGAAIGKTGTRAVGKGVARTASGIKNRASGLAERLPAGIKTALRKVPSEDRNVIVNTTVSNIKDSLITTKSVTNKLEQTARRAGTTVDDLLRQLVDEGGVPRVDGELARFGDVVDDFQMRQNNLAHGIDELLARQPELTDLSSMREQAESILRTSPQIGAELDQSVKELDRFFNSLENRFGKQLSAQDVNRIRVQMNQKTGAFKGEKFTQDTEDAIADVARSRLNEISDDGLVRQANAEWGKLQRLKKVANTLNNQKIQVNQLVEDLGSFWGTAFASAAGISVSGPGGLVVAGLAARYGSGMIAQFMRNRKFSPELKNTVSRAIRQDEELVNKLIQQASDADKAILQRKLLPEPAIRQSAARSQRESSIEVKPARKDTARDPKSGRFKRIFKSD